MDFRSAYSSTSVATNDSPANHDATLDTGDVTLRQRAVRGTTGDDIASWNADLSDQPAHRIVRYALARAERPMLSSSFGPDSAAMIRLVRDVRADVPIVWIDSGFNTPETLNFATGLAREWSLDLRIYRPLLDPTRLLEQFGSMPVPGDPEHDRFTEMVKLEPFRRAMRELRPDVWLTGIRSNETEHRQRLDIASPAPQGAVKIAPMLHWNDADVGNYLHARDLPNGHAYHDVVTRGARLECGLHDRL